MPHATLTIQARLGHEFEGTTSLLRFGPQPPHLWRKRHLAANKLTSPIQELLEIADPHSVWVLGKGQACVWTYDLTHGYIDINGSYRS